MFGGVINYEPRYAAALRMIMFSLGQKEEEHRDGNSAKEVVFGYAFGTLFFFYFSPNGIFVYSSFHISVFVVF